MDAKTKDEPKYSDLIKILDDRDLESLNKHLGNSREKTLKALIWATYRRRLNIHEEKGKQIWQHVHKYLSENNFNDDLSGVEERLNHIYHPIRSYLTECLDGFLGGVCTQASFAGKNGYEIARRLTKKYHHRNAIMLVYG